MRRGLVFSGGDTLQEVLALARTAEGKQFDSIYHVEALRSAFVPLTAIAAVTERVQIGTYVLNAYGHTPFAAGMSAIDLDELSGGRLLLAVGSGNRHINEEFQGVQYARPLTKMADYVELLRLITQAKEGVRVDYDGAVHSMHWTAGVAPARDAIPVYMAGIGPRMRDVAARHADGIALGALFTADYVRDVVRPQASIAAAGAGKDPAALGYKMAAFASVHEDPEAARDAARDAICRTYSPIPHPYYDFLIREQGFSRVADLITRHMDAGNRAAAKEAMDDEFISAITISGTPADCRAAIRRYDGLIDEVIFRNVASTVSGVVASYEALFALDL